jgi:hypothetical protein
LRRPGAPFVPDAAREVREVEAARMRRLIAARVVIRISLPETGRS